MLQASTPPTRAVLLEARRSLALTRQGHDLLERKRQALIAYAQDMLAHAEDVEGRLDQAFQAAYEALGRARMSMGVERVEWVALGIAGEAQVEITERSVMGVPVPAVRPRPHAFRLQYGLGGTTAAIDQTAQAFHKLFPLVCQAAELETAALRLAREIKRTQRRVNALQNILIPRYESIVARVEAALDEKEREDFYRAKAVKRLPERAGPARGAAAEE